MSRLQTGALRVDASAIGLDEVVPAALRSIGARAEEIEVEVPETLPRVVADPGLLERAVANVVENALAHGAGSGVRVVAGVVEDGVDLRVVDRGPGVRRELQTGCSCPSSGSGTARRTGAWASGSRLRAGSSRRWAGRSRSRTRRAEG